MEDVGLAAHSPMACVCVCLSAPELAARAASRTAHGPIHGSAQRCPPHDSVPAIAETWAISAGSSFRVAIVDHRQIQITQGLRLAHKLAATAASSSRA